MRINDPIFSAHGARCPSCRASDYPKDMCRTGRRLFLKWLRRMTLEQRTIFIMGMPDDIRKEVSKFFDDGVIIQDMN